MSGEAPSVAFVPVDDGPMESGVAHLAEDLVALMC
jgi:hypothetical protein